MAKPKTHIVKLNDEDSVDLMLPNGKKVSIQYSKVEDEQLPELDIMLPHDMAANCFDDHLQPARPLSSGHQHIRIARQIIIVVEKKPG